MVHKRLVVGEAVLYQEFKLFRQSCVARVRRGVC
jgi:hypothetical protein